MVLQQWAAENHKLSSLSMSGALASAIKHERNEQAANRPARHPPVNAWRATGCLT